MKIKKNNLHIVCSTPKASPTNSSLVLSSVMRRGWCCYIYQQHLISLAMKACSGSWRAMGLRSLCYALLHTSRGDTYRVDVDGCFSDWHQVHCNAHQGGALGLVLFNIFISNFVCTTHNTLYGYADDVTLDWNYWIFSRAPWGSWIHQQWSETYFQVEWKGKHFFFRTSK